MVSTHKTDSGLGFRFRPIRTTTDNILSKAKQAYNREGLSYVLRSGLMMSLGYLFIYYYKMFKSSETFEFQGKKYHYFFHRYCTTWRNERAIVVPIIWDILNGSEDKRKNILEVGNMLSYYFKVDHDIVDKYEIIDGVINKDVVDFTPLKKYDFIFSLMSLQCVGLYESPQEPRKFLRAIENLKTILAKGGQILIFHGLGENKEADELLKSGALKFKKQFYLKRIFGYNWKEVNWEDVKDLEYDFSIPTANGVVVGIIENNINP
jgi:hypothetical protein